MIYEGSLILSIVIATIYFVIGFNMAEEFFLGIFLHYKINIIFGVVWPLFVLGVILGTLIYRGFYLLKSKFCRPIFIFILPMLLFSGCASNEKAVFVPIYVDYRCFDDDGVFNDSMGADDLDCGNMWFIKKTIELKKAGSE